MIPRMQLRTTRWGEFTEVDLPAIGAGQFVPVMSTSHASLLTWTCLVPQHTTPLPERGFIRFWIDDADDPAGDPFSAENPLFEGYITQVDPQPDAIGVQYTAHDPTYEATKKVTIFSDAWVAGNPPSEPATPPANGVPVLIYNCSNETDPDFAHQVGGYGTLYQLIAGILEFCYFGLVDCDAAPGDGVEEGLAYDDAELSTLTVKPQEKCDFRSEGVRSALERLQRYDPRLRLFWEPGTRLWRVRPLTAAPVVTLRLNRRDVDFPVLSLSLKRSTDKCVTAVSIYGPPTVEVEEFRWDDPVDYQDIGATYGDESTLQPLGDPVVLEEFTTSAGTFDSRCWLAFQIIDPAKRRGALQFPDWYQYQRTPLLFGQTRVPRVLCSWDRGETWLEWPNIQPPDIINGIVRFIGDPPKFYMVDSTGGSLNTASTQKWFCPTSIRLIWGPFAEPLKVRRPASGYEGTAFTAAGITVEDYQSDSALVIGFEYGNPVTSADRRAAMETYAQTLLDQRKDIVWTGVAVLDGLDWQFSRLHKTCRIVAEDGSGNEIDTPWNDIDAYVTDVSYDLEEQTTTLTFSADRLALFGIDAETLKRQLGIKPLQQIIEMRTWFLYGQRPLPSGKLVTEVIGVESQPVFHYVDPETL